MRDEPGRSEDILENWRAAPVAAITSAFFLSVALVIGGGWITSHGGWFIVPGLLVMSGVVWIIACAVRLSVRLTANHVLVYGLLWNRKVPRDRIVTIGALPLMMSEIPTLRWRTKHGFPVWTLMSAMYPGGVGYSAEVAEDNLQRLRTALGN